MNSKKTQVISQLVLFIIVMITIIMSCEKKVSAPGVENQAASTTSGTTGSTTGGTTTGGTTTGSGTGQGMFWVQSSLGCGTITVYISGVGKTITSYYASGAPSCGASGCATYNLSPGTYAFTASCSGYTWGTSTPAYITITAGGCSTMKLN
jgi:hypothetical protein